MAARTRSNKRTRIASRRRLNVARPTEGRLVPAPQTSASSPLVRLLAMQPLDQDGHLPQA